MRILAIDLRAQRFGFAVLDGPKKLLDFGTKILERRREKDATAIVVQKKIGSILNLYMPAIVIIKCVSGLHGSARLRNQQLLSSIRHEVRKQGLELIMLERSDIRRSFRQSGNESKHEIAVFIAEWFPEVEWRLPPNRKNWQPEHHTMPIFDAISIGLTYFIQLGDVFPATPQSETRKG
jgi:RNase H-fold protein (predicted Holliday junction resolvase)